MFVETPFSRFLIKQFVAHYQIDLTEVDSSPSNFQTFGAFFRRTLKAGARPIAEGVVSPVDGRVQVIGSLPSDGTMIQVKGKAYRLSELVSQTGDDLNLFLGGSYITVYLSPRDYHRIHAPMAATLRKYVHVPGTLFPVNAFSANHIERLFARNERTVGWFESMYGPFIMVMVGAAGVGTVQLSFDPNVNTARRRTWYSKECRQTFERGDEVGYFTLGSTVIVLFPNQVEVKWLVKAGDRVQMGQAIAHVQARQPTVE